MMVNTREAPAGNRAAAGDRLAVRDRIAVVDPFSGASGDMLLGALVDCGVAADDLARALRAVPLQGYELSVRRVRKAGIAATKVDVVTGQEHHHRGLGDILDLLNRSQLPEASVEKAAAIFRRLAEAEARVHGVTPEEIHFHEVGAVDAIVDVVGAVEGFRLLGVERILCGPLPLAYGRTRAAHGVIPLPAPATVELLKGFPVREGEQEGELVTPTGAAVLCTLAEPALSWPRLAPEVVGYGAGSRDLRHPNVLRLVVGRAWSGTLESAGAGPVSGFLPSSFPVAEIEAARQLGAAWEEALMVECNLDDMNPQLFGYVQKRLFEAGAVDVFLTPVQMKKNRPGVKLAALCHPERAVDLVGILLRETTTLGVRGQRVGRWVADRREQEVQTPYGPVRVKLAYLGEELVNVAPEYEDCLQVAARAGVPLKQVFRAALQAAPPHCSE